MLSGIKSKKVWLVMTGFSCNNNCVMCSTKPKAEKYNDRKTEDIVGDLIKGKRKGYQRAEFTGGEPTIRDDIFFLMRKARELGYKEVAVSTNARMFSYQNFCKQSIQNGLNRVTFTLNSHNSRLGHAISRTPSSFEQSLQGIKNLVKQPNLEVSANTVVIKPNYKYLSEIGSLLAELGVSIWNILDLIPDGYAEDFYKMISVEMLDLSSCFRNLEDNIIKKFGLVTFFDFPMCLFSPELRNNKKTSFVNTRGRMEIEEQTGYSPKRFQRSKNGVYEDIHKKRIAICGDCKFVKSCGGIWVDSLNLYGEDEISELAMKNKCIN